jgi:hypothetical protein
MQATQNPAPTRGKETISMTMKLQLGTANRLVRTFVPTTDPRCPLVAVWKLAGSTDAASADEPSLLRLAMDRLLRASWRALHIPFARFAYSTV